MDASCRYHAGDFRLHGKVWYFVPKAGFRPHNIDFVFLQQGILLNGLQQSILTSLFCSEKGYTSLSTFRVLLIASGELELS